MFKLQIETDNAAFEHGGGAEIARILRETADRTDAMRLYNGGRITNELRDSNGNTVGTVKWVAS